MQVCMHRGANQIGGSCIQPKYQQHRQIIDLGLPLDAGSSQLNNVPDALNLMPAGEGRLSAIISHVHIDHYSLAHHFPAKKNSGLHRKSCAADYSGQHPVYWPA